MRTCLLLSLTVAVFTSAPTNAQDLPTSIRLGLGTNIVDYRRTGLNDADGEELGSEASRLLKGCANRAPVRDR